MHLLISFLLFFFLSLPFILPRSYGELLYDRRTGLLAVLVLGFSQAFIISIYDVKTDSILTGATIFSIYQFIRFSVNKKYIHIHCRKPRLAIAVGSKGMIAVVVTGWYPLSSPGISPPMEGNVPVAMAEYYSLGFLFS
jgi:4-amino-4-deoxy-L-arabinose transferase-like glycosyltransferase